MTSDDLYLTNHHRAKNHQKLHHYTSIESFGKIVSSQSLRLSCLAIVNDIEEEERLDAVLKNKVFVACFNNIEEESISMWRQYTKHKAGLRITFPNIEFLEISDNYFYLESESESKFPDNKWEIREARIFDIEYVEDPYKFYNTIDPLDTGATIKVPSAVGLVKRMKWSNECETRVRTYIDVVKGHSSIDFSEKRIKYSRPNFQHIYCKISRACLYSVEITLNPFLDEVGKQLIKNEILNIMPGFAENHIHESGPYRIW